MTKFCLFKVQLSISMKSLNEFAFTEMPADHRMETSFAQADDVRDISHISACLVRLLLSSFSYFTTYRQAKCISYCLTLNPAHGFILMTNAAIQK